MQKKCSECHSAKGSGAPQLSQGLPQQLTLHVYVVVPIANVVVATMKPQSATVSGELENMCVEVMPDSGSSISLIMESFINSSYQT